MATAMAMPVAGMQPFGYNMQTARGRAGMPTADAGMMAPGTAAFSNGMIAPGSTGISAAGSGMATPAAPMGVMIPGVFTGTPFPTAPPAAMQMPTPAVGSVGNSSSFRFMQSPEGFPPAAASSNNAAKPLLPTQSHSGLQLVSLGCSCGPKMSFDAMGCGQETLPFDWMCTTIEGIIMLLTTDFQGFFDFNTREKSSSGGVEFEVFRSATHSWWHADPTDPPTREKYTRRIHRLNSMQAHSTLILFVRLLASSNELPHAGQLMAALMQKFGPMSKLLIILTGQNEQQSYMMDGMPNLLIILMPVASGMNAYCEPISTAQRWVAGQSPNARHLQNLNMIPGLMPSHNGYFGMGGLAAFENLPPGIPWPPRADGKPHLGAARPDAAGMSSAPMLFGSGPRVSLETTPIARQPSMAGPPPPQMMSPNRRSTSPNRPTVAPALGVMPQLARTNSSASLPRSHSMTADSTDRLSRTHSHSGDKSMQMLGVMPMQLPQFPPLPAWGTLTGSVDSRQGMSGSFDTRQREPANRRVSPPMSPSRGSWKAPSPAKVPSMDGHRTPPLGSADVLNTSTRQLDTPLSRSPSRPRQDSSHTQVVFKKGDRVKVWSKTANSWRPAVVDSIDGPMVWTNFQTPDGSWMRKGIPEGHSFLRRSTTARFSGKDKFPSEG